MSNLVNIKILYVEDEEEVRESITRALKRRAKEVITAKDGKEGLELFVLHKPDIVVTDLEMPVMNGIEMIEEIRKIYGRDYPIVVVTAYRDDEHFTDLADCYVYKPVDLVELENAISSLIIK